MAVAHAHRALEPIGVTRWVLVLEPVPSRQQRLWRKLERYGLGVVTVTTVEEADGCLAVMRPALVVAGDLPGASDFLDRARSVGVEAASYSDVVREQLA
jgi:hypothetical protein